MKTKLLICFFLFTSLMQVNAQVPPYLIKNKKSLDEIKADFAKRKSKIENKVKKISELEVSKKNTELLYSLRIDVLNNKEEKLKLDVEKLESKIIETEKTKKNNWSLEVKKNENLINILRDQQKEVGKVLEQMENSFVKDTTNLIDTISTLKDEEEFIKIKRADTIVYVKPVKGIFAYNRLEASKEKAIKARQEIVEELKTNGNLLSEENFNAKQNSLDTLAKAIRKYERKQDNLFRKYLSTDEGKKDDLVFFPNQTRVNDVLKKLYDGEKKNESLRILSNGGLSIGHSTSSIYSEFVSGNLKIVRVSMGMMVSASNGDDAIKAKEDEAYQRLVSYGGNTVLNFDYPALYYSAVDKKANIIGNVNLKGSCDIPAMGTKTEDWAGSGSLGINLYGDLSTENDKIRFFASFGIRQIFGTRLFRENLGVEEKSITFGQLDVGLVILSNVKISFTILTFSNVESLQNRNVIMGAQVMQ